MPTQAERRLIEKITKFYQQNQNTASHFLQVVLIALKESKPLAETIHSVKSRLKDPDHLRDKLCRKLDLAKRKRQAFGVTSENLFVKVTDIVGIRILHLHTWQFPKIDSILRDIFAEQKYKLVQGPFARTWDDEYRDFFKSNRVKIHPSPTMYTSVHYVIESASRTKIACEIQVRTLMEEVWGEVDHTLNYPHPIDDVACREQIKVLARVTSSATRLVDSIFASAEDSKTRKLVKPRKKGR
jgi:GTP pyrophosphokinase